MFFFKKLKMTLVKKSLQKGEWWCVWRKKASKKGSGGVEGGKVSKKGSGGVEGVKEVL